MPAEPGGYNAHSEAPAGDPPGVVRGAFLLMMLSALIGLVSFILLIAQKDTLRDQIAKSNPDFDAGRLDTAVNAAITIGAVIGFVFLVLYVLLAFQVRKGKNWARIVTWVLAGIGVLGTLANLGQESTAAARTAQLISGLMDLLIIVLLIMANRTGWFSRRRLA
jgi:hypothetical protein